jgi:hypothetical protein
MNLAALHLLSSEKFGQVAQLVEQWTENPCVGGSIPSLSTLKALSIQGFFIFRLSSYNVIVWYAGGSQMMYRDWLISIIQRNNTMYLLCKYLSKEIHA